MVYTEKNKKTKGKKGEILARKYLESQGLHYIEANYTIWGGEIDIVMKDLNQYVFVEVKIRKKGQLPVGAIISKSKERALIRTSQKYLMEKNMQAESVRIDVVGVYLEGGKVEFEWIKNAIY